MPRGRFVNRPYEALQIKDYLLASSTATATAAVIPGLGVVTCAEDFFNSSIICSFGFSPNQIIKCNTVVISKLYCRPERKLALSPFISLVNGKLHIQQFGYLLLCFIAIFSQIAHSWIYKHILTSQIVCEIII